MAEYYSTVYMYYNFFIHSSVGRHLGCYHVLAVVNTASRSNGICMSFSIVVSSGYTPKSGTTGPTSALLIIGILVA